MVTVRDTGIRLSRESIEHVFKAFHSFCFTLPSHPPQSAASQIETGDFRFYAALARAAAWNSASSEERPRHFAALIDHHRQLEIWARHCPANFENRTALVSAEIARIEGRIPDAEHLYEAAIRLAHDNGFAHCEAVANSGELNVEVTVRDSGIGLDPATREQIFTAFYKTKPSGLGMGLSTVCLID